MLCLEHKKCTDASAKHHAVQIRSTAEKPSAKVMEIKGSDDAGPYLRLMCWPRAKPCPLSRCGHKQHPQVHPIIAIQLLKHPLGQHTHAPHERSRSGLDPVVWHLERSRHSGGVPRRESESGHPRALFGGILGSPAASLNPIDPSHQPLSPHSVLPQDSHCPPGPPFPFLNVQPVKELKQEKPSLAASSQQPALKATPRQTCESPQEGETKG